MQATTPEDNSFFQRKRRAASGGTRTRDLLRSRQMLYQLSHRGMQAKQHVHVYVALKVMPKMKTSTTIGYQAV